MARKMTEWPSKRGPITKIMPSDGCIGDTVPLAVGKWYEFHEFGWYMGNVGYKKQYKNDRSVNSDQNGNYDGTYEPERSYVTAILAFLDEFQIGADLVDISDVEDNRDFYMQFGRFKSKVEYIVTRHRLRIGRLRSGTSGTVLEIELDFKAEIGKHLETVRKIVNKEVNDKKKKEKIIRKIGSLKLEVDRDITTADAPAGHLTDVCPVIPAKAGASQGKRDKCSGISRPGLRAGTSTPPQEVPDQVRDGWSSARRVRPCPPQSKLPSTASSLAHTGWRAEFGAAMNSSTTRTRSVLATRPSVTTCSPASRWSSRSATSRKSASAG